MSPRSKSNLKERKVQMKIDADAVINLLVDAYREQLEDDGDFVAEEFYRGYNEEISGVSYDSKNDLIEFHLSSVEGVLRDVMKNRRWKPKK
jgi:hypothetical protein